MGSFVIWLLMAPTKSQQQPNFWGKDGESQRILLHQFNEKKTKAVSGHLLSSPVVHLGLPDSEASLAYYDKLKKGEGRLVGAYVLNHQHQTKRIGDDEILE